MRKWTEEERQNAMRYGMCTECGEPRRVEMICTTAEDGTLDVEYRFDPTTCPHMAERSIRDHAEA